MPILLGLVTVVLNVLFIVHVVRTGRERFWIWIILGFPVLGALAYVMAEVVPELVRGPRGEKMREAAAAALDPERAWREAQQRFEMSDTIDNRRALAREAVRLGRPEEALELLLPARQGMYVNDPALLIGLAEAYFAANQPARTVALLEELKQAQPEFESAEAHLLYARAQEASGRLSDALAEYEAVSRYYPGEEARCRHAAAVAAAGQPERAAAIYAVVCRSVERSPEYYRRAQRQWYDLAKGHLER